MVSGMIAYMCVDIVIGHRVIGVSYWDIPGTPYDMVIPFSSIACLKLDPTYSPPQSILSSVSLEPVLVSYHAIAFNF